jgi:uncharacterized protein YjiS (DUF1127 family)
MSCYFHGESAIAAAGRRTFSWQASLAGAISLVRTWLTRRQRRQELLDYIASDHRAAADIGITGCEARGWSERPFWRA